MQAVSWALGVLGTECSLAVHIACMWTLPGLWLQLLCRQSSPDLYSPVFTE